MQLSKDQMIRLAERVSAGCKPRREYIEAWGNVDVLEQYGITTKNRLAAFMATCLAETGGFHIVRENMNYSAQRIKQVWPSRPGAAKFAHNPEGLANAVYNGRMGNRPGSNDGYLYRGGGLIQTTGKEGYKRGAAASGLPLLEHSDLLEQGRPALIVAAEEASHLLKYADQGQSGFRAFSNGINRGNPLSSAAPIGWADRQHWYRRVVEALSHLDSEDAPAAHDLGSDHPEVQEAQKILITLGYTMVGKPDGIFGPRTQTALLSFQANNDLEKTGQLDEKTLECLRGNTSKAFPRSRRPNETLADLGHSTIVRGSKSVDATGKGIFGLGAAAFLGPDATEYLEKFDILRPVMEKLREVFSWGADNIRLVAGVALVVAGWYITRKVKEILKAKLEAHQAGTDITD